MHCARMLLVIVAEHVALAASTLSPHPPNNTPTTSSTRFPSTDSRQPLPYLPTSNRNRQPRIPLPQIPQLPLDTQGSPPTRIRHRHMRRIATIELRYRQPPRCF